MKPVYSVFTLNWFEGSSFVHRTMPIQNCGVDFGILDSPEGIYWRAGSAVQDPNWKGKLVVGLPRGTVSAIKAMGLQKGDRKGCWLS